MSSALSDEETTMPERGNEHGPGCDAVAAYAATADVDWPQRVVGMYDEILARLTKES